MITLRRLGARRTEEISDRPPQALNAGKPLPYAYEGRLQGVGDGHVLGFCWAPDAPDVRVQITIVVDGEIAAEGQADVARPDLAGYGDGAHGFLIALPDSLKAPGRHRVLALAGPGKTPLAASPSFWHTSKNGWSDTIFEPGQTLPTGALPAKVPAPPNHLARQAVSVAGWLFDAREFEPSPTPTASDLDAIVTNLTTTASTCAALGIDYLPVLVPAKRRVVGVTPPLDRGWVTAVKVRLRDVDEVDLLDLLPVIRHAERHGPTYNRTDADWNDRGAFFVTRALLKEVHKRMPALKPPALADLHLRPVPAYRGTLADQPKLELLDGELLPCEPKIEAEDGVVIDAHELHALRMPVESHLAEAGSTHLRVYTGPESLHDTHIAVVGDSVSLPVVRWLAERTRRTTFFWSDSLPLTQLELELPPVAIHLVRETNLLQDGMKTVSREVIRTRGTTHPDAIPTPTLPPPVTLSAATQPASEVSITAEPTPAMSSSPPQAPPAYSTKGDLNNDSSVDLTPTPRSTLPGSEPAHEPTASQRLLAFLAGVADRDTRKAWLRAPDPRWPVAVLGAALFGFGLLLIVLSRHFGFFGDDYYWILHRRAWNIDAFWQPHNGHLSVVPVTLYKLLFVTVGLQHTWPYRLILVGLHLLCVALIYVLAARRAGRWIALVPAFLLLGLGSGFEDLLWAFQIGFVGSLAAGLGAVVCLERRSRRGDLATAMLIAISLGSASVGLAMAVAIFVEILVTRSPWRRLWIVLGPLALYGIWYLQFGTNEALLSNVPRIPSVDLETGAYGFAAFGGLAVGYGQILLTSAIAFLVVRGWRGRTLPARTIAGIAGALTFWTSTALARAQYDEPGTSRYIYPSAVFILIAAVGLLRWRRFSLRAWALLGLIIAAAGLSNGYPLFTYAKDRTQVDAEIRDVLGAAQMAGPAGSPTFLPDAHHLPWLHLGEYLAAVKDLGSPAFTPEQIAAQPEDDRELADNVILSAESLPLVQPNAEALLTAVPAPIHRFRGVIVDRTTVAANTSCTRLTPNSSKDFATIIVSPGTGLYLSMRGQGHVAIYVRRLAHHMSSRPLHVLPAVGTPALLQFPHDAGKLAWHVRLIPTTRTAVCLV